MKTITSLFIVTAILLVHNAHADTLKDPTQVPAALSSAVDADNAAQPVVTGPVLQSVMLGTQYHAAIINGQKVMLGNKYEQATLIKLNEHEAVLRSPDGTTQTLVMNYAIEKTVISPVTPAVAKKKVKRASNHGSNDQSK